MNGPLHSLSASVSCTSHLIDAEPIQPGTISRAGPPWRWGSGRPFISIAIIVCGSIAFQIGWLRMKSGA